MLEIVHRSLTDAEAVRVHQELKTTPNILGYTVRELKRLTDVYVAEMDGVFAGVCFCVDLAMGWTEIAALYVLPEFRGRSIGQVLFRAAWDRCRERKRHVYVLSRNPQVIAWMRVFGMSVDGRHWRAPLAIYWYLFRYMASWHRSAASVRKRREIAKCPALLQGTKRFL